MPDVTELGDKIAGLTIAQAVELKNYLEGQVQDRARRRRRS